MKYSEIKKLLNHRVLITFDNGNNEYGFLTKIRQTTVLELTPRIDLNYRIPLGLPKKSIVVHADDVSAIEDMDWNGKEDVGTFNVRMADAFVRWRDNGKAKK